MVKLKSVVIGFILLTVSLTLVPNYAAVSTPTGAEHPQYEKIKMSLLRGWNTWDSRSVLRYVLLPEGFVLNLALKQPAWLDEGYLRTALIGRRGEDSEKIRPGIRTYDGGYTSLEIHWRGLRATVQTAVVDNDLVILITPVVVRPIPANLVLETGMAWNRPGLLRREGDSLAVDLPGRTLRVFSSREPVADPYVDAMTPYMCFVLNKPLVISTGRRRTVTEVESILNKNRMDLEQSFLKYCELAGAAAAIQSVIAWNTIYEPRHDRVVSTVGRLWNEEYGGYCLFGWDNFFLAYMAALNHRDLAYANIIEHLEGQTPAGLIPNDNRGNGSKSWDRSQPPVGAIMVREIYKIHRDRWLLEATFDRLLAWNRWWVRARNNHGLLSYGSHPTLNPFHEPVVHTRTAAGYESGMDDSPMYEGVPFNPTKNTLELQDVGLNSLYLADCAALAEIAGLLGREVEQRELSERRSNLVRKMEGLWSEKAGAYLNRRTDTGNLSPRLSPTMFYPLLSNLPGPERARRMIKDHLLNPDEFYGDWMIPSAPRNDPSFPKQRYWKGAIWPPLNFLTYLGLRRTPFGAIRAELARKSLALFMKGWREKGYVGENYSAITGTRDDPRLSSDPFHSWGGLLAVMAFIEKGFLPPPEAPLPTGKKSRGGIQ